MLWNLKKFKCMRESLRDPLRLEHILDAIDRLLAGDKITFNEVGKGIKKRLFSTTYPILSGGVQNIRESSKLSSRPVLSKNSNI